MRSGWIGVVVAGLLALAGCTPGTPQSSVANSPSGSAATSSLLRVGDCTGPVDLTGAAISGLTAIDCAQPHYYEVHASVPIDGDDYPGAPVLGEQAKAACGPSFIDYVGVEPAYSKYSSAYLVPDAATWADPANRMITCLLGSASGGLTGSAAGDTLVFPELGDCTGPQNVPVLEIQTIACDQPHSYEVFAEKAVTGAKAPSQTETDKLFTSVCLEGFKDFVGVTAAKSTYEVTYYLTGAQLWDKVADHRIVCSAGSPDGGITGTLKGAKK